MTLRARQPLQILRLERQELFKMSLNSTRPTAWDSTPNGWEPDVAAGGNKSARVVLRSHLFGAQETGRVVRKLIAFDEDTFDKLTQLGRDRMATIQELADEAFADLLRKHGIPIDLKDALRKSAGRSKIETPNKPRSSPARKTRS
jgi:hypothetical protein